MVFRRRWPCTLSQGSALACSSCCVCSA
uniref:Uncharacterized protein n=1 Tax=Anguilla anguilla TaxID=7936 RepID=A0A0E9SAU0_ANGAN